MAEQSFRTAVLCLSIFNAYFNELLLFTKTEYYAMKKKGGGGSEQNIMTVFRKQERVEEIEWELKAENHMHSPKSR